MRIGLYKVCLYVVITRRVSWKNIIDIVFVREYNILKLPTPIRCVEP